LQVVVELSLRKCASRDFSERIAKHIRTVWELKIDHWFKIDIQEVSADR